MDFTTLSIAISDLENHVTIIRDVARSSVYESKRRTSAEATTYLDNKITFAKIQLGRDVDDFMKGAFDKDSSSDYYDKSDLSNCEILQPAYEYLTLWLIYEDLMNKANELKYVANSEEGQTMLEWKKWERRYKDAIQIFSYLEITDVLQNPMLRRTS